MPDVNLPNVEPDPVTAEMVKECGLVGLGRTQKISNQLNGHFWAFYDLNNDQEDIFKGKFILKTGIQFNLVNRKKKFENHITEKMKMQREYSLKKESLENQKP
jgi:hypothetical protein